MANLRPGLLVAVILVFVIPCFVAQAGTPDDVFTILVTAPTSAKDVQVRYWFTDEAGGQQSSVADSSDDNKIVIKTRVQEKSARSFKAIAYAPGCQFVTIDVGDLAASNRRSEFQCRKLPATQLTGHVNVSAFGGRELKVEVLYQVEWAGEFYGLPGVSVSPLFLGKADVGSDGSFGLEVPDFSADPLWQSLTRSATLTFFLSDARSGNRVAALLPANATPAGARLKIAPTYPEIEFAIQPQDAPALR